MKTVNTMKKFAFLFVLFLVLTGSSAFAQNIITESQISVTITKDTSREQLWQIHQDLKVQGIDFNYTPRFDSQFKLMSIQYTVKRNDGEVLGTAGNNNLLAPNQRTKITLNKQGNNFVATCIGNCE